MVETALARIILTNRIGADQSGAHAGFQFVMSAPEPIHTIVSAARNTGVLHSNLLDVGGTEFLLHFIFRLKGRIADNRIYLRPLAKQRIVAADVGVEVLHRQRPLAGVELQVALLEVPAALVEGEL